MPIDNNMFQKNANTSLVARLVWQRKSISRAEIARVLGLYRSTVTNITSYLINAGVIREGNLMSSTQQGGRKAVELSINPDFGCVFGFDVQPSHYRAVIVAADGTELWRETGSFGVIPVLEMIDKILKRAFEAHRNIGSPVLALSFAIPGIVDDSYGSILNSFPFGIRDVDIRSYIREKYDYPVFIENDANTAAWLDVLSNGAWGNAISVVADYHEEFRTAPDIVGIGAGIGLIIAGKVYRGTHNAAGEFKSVTWREGMSNQSGLSLDVLRNTQDDKDCLGQWIADTFKSFIPLVSVMDPEKVILHGRPFEDKDWVLSTLEARVPEFMDLMRVFGFSLVFNSVDECVSASGAAMMCLHNLFSVPELTSDGQNGKFMWEETIAFLQGQKQ